MKSRLLKTGSIAIACLFGAAGIFTIANSISNETKEAKATGYSYMGWDKDTESLIEMNTGEEEVTVIEEGMSYLSRGWYVVDHNVTITTSLTFHGTANIILEDGKTLTIQNGLKTDVFGNICVYGQSGHTGRLDISSTEGAGIIISDHDYSSLTVYGGQVGSNGSDSSTGYNTGLDGNLVMYGGLVILQGHSNASAHYAGIIGNTTINGGQFYSRGSQVTTEGVAGKIYGGCGFVPHAFKSDDGGANWVDEPLVNDTTDVNYVKVIAGKAYPTIGNEVITETNTSGEGWSFDIDTFTLSLNNYTFEGDAPLCTKTSICGAINYEGTKILNIVNNGTNVLTNTAVQSYACGISSFGGFVFTGEGTLTATATRSTSATYGIYSQGPLTINSGTINTYGGPAGNEYGNYSDSCGIYCSDGCFLNGGTIDARGGEVFSGTSAGIYYNSVGLTIGNNVNSFTASGKSQALRLDTTNAYSGKGWTNEEGTEGETVINAGAHEAYTELFTLKKVEFISPVSTVIGLINNIGEVEYNTTCKGRIDAARNAYDALSSGEKVLVTNYSVLTDAETKYAALKADHDAADAVITKINNIGEVSYTDECKAKIDDARSSYDALTATQKTYVTNLSTLEEAEAKYQELTPSGDVPALFPGWVIAIIIVGGVLVLLCGAWALMMFVFNKWIKVDNKAIRAFKLFGLKNKEGKYFLLGFPVKFVSREEVQIYKTKDEALK